MTQKLDLPPLYANHQYNVPERQLQKMANWAINNIEKEYQIGHNLDKLDEWDWCALPSGEQNGL